MTPEPTEREQRLEKVLLEIRSAAVQAKPGGHFIKPDWLIKRVDRALEKTTPTEAHRS